MGNNTEQLITIVQRALSEDIGDGDVTTECTVPLGKVYKGKLIAKAAGVVAGLDIAHMTFKMLDEQVQWEAYIEDGSTVEKGTIIATVIGQGRALLSAERVALNLLQRMSGIATLTRRFVMAAQGTSATILDTRKTVPGLRLLDKQAVLLGGGQNHRFGLYDMVLIKENHIAAAGSISQAVNQVRAQDGRKRAIEVEVQNLTELRQALALNVDRIMLDNMSLEQMREAVQIVKGQIPLEASGNVSLQTVSQIAATGVDYISAGKLTHSVLALDISFILEPFASQ